MTKGQEFQESRSKVLKRIISNSTEITKNYKRSRIGDKPCKELKILKVAQNTEKKKNTDCRVIHFEDETM